MGFKKKLVIILAVCLFLFILALANQNRIIKYLYKQRPLGNLVAKTVQQSGRQSKILNFIFSLDALRFFNSMGNAPLSQEKKWLDGVLKIGNQNHTITFSNFENYFKRLKLKNKNRAFTIRFTPDDATITENEFDLFQVRGIDSYEQELIYQLAEQLDIYTPRTEHVNVYINYADQGDYVFKNSYSQYFIQQTALADSILFMLDQNKKGSWSSRFLLNEPKKEEIKSHFKHFLQLMRKEDPHLLEKYFDLDYMARFEVLREILGAETGFSIEDNIRFIWKKDNGRFYPILDEANIYNMLQNRENKNFKLLARQIDRSTKIARKKWEYRIKLQQSYKGILDKYRQITKKYIHVSPDFVTTLNVKIIAHYYLNNVYQRINHKPGPLPAAIQLASESNESLNRAENYLDHLIISPDTFMTKNKDLKLRFTQNRFILERGDYHLLKDLVIPRGYSFDISAGSRLRLAGGVSIISYSPLNILGTEKEPVVIQALNAKSPFGVLAVHGTGGESCRISHLDFSGASGDILDGVRYKHGINLFNVHLEMTFSSVHGVQCNSGLKIQRGSVFLENNQFYNNHSDQVVVEFSKGVVQNNRLSKHGGDPKGDGLAIDGSQVVVKDNYVSRFQDKGISIGRQSRVILYNNTIVENTIGVAVKDSAEVLLLNNKIQNNGDGVSAFQKDRFFNGGTCYFLENGVAADNKLFKIDKFSTFFRLNDCQDFEEQFKQFIARGEVESLFPLFKKLTEKCIDQRNHIKSFALGSHKAHIDEKNKIIFIHLPTGASHRQIIHYVCSVEQTDIYLNPIMSGVTSLGASRSRTQPKRVKNHEPYDFKEFIFTGEIYFHFNNRYDLYDLIVTTGNHGVIKIDTRDRRGNPRLIKDEPKIGCTFVIITPQAAGQPESPDYRIHYLGGKIEGRGQPWPKWKYGISLERSIPLAGMTAGKNWVLESSFVEKSLMRSKVAFDLLAKIQKNHDKKWKFAPQSRFIEVILNERYHGVYLLMQHINNDFLNLEKYDPREPVNAVLYRCHDENANFSPINLHITKNKDYRFFTGSRMPVRKGQDPIYGWHSGFHQRHPNVDRFGEYWDVLDNFCKFTALSSDTIFENRIFSLMERNAYIELWLFIQLLDDHDGVIKNRYLARRRGPNSKWFFVPWDKDGIFGRSFNMKKRPHDKWLHSPLFDRVMKIQSFRRDFSKEWKKWRANGIISSENINHMIDENVRSLRDLQERNFRRWPTDLFTYPDQNTFYQEISYMKRWISRRIIWLDQRIDILDKDQE